MLDALNSERFADMAPASVHATLLDEGVYLGSVRTMYRVLGANGASHERRNQRVHPAYTKPELLAVQPNQVWSWDITKLKGPAKWTCFHLYVILDIFSRLVVGWLIAEREDADLAQQLIADSVARHDIAPGTLTLHADRGTSMRSKPVAALLVDLDIAKSHSRPYVSDDNPYSEAQFKTLKYRPDFPARFGCIEDARAHCQAFFAWYNAAHRHSGIGYMTPHNVHHGQAEQLRGVRQAVLDEAFLATPNRFKGRRPEPHALPTAVWINPPSPETINPKSQQPCAVNS
jgi:putative transposase